VENKDPKKIGLTDDEVNASRLEFGSNILTKKKQKSFIGKFFSNLNDPVIRILLGALAVNIFFAVRSGSWAETVGIAAAVFLAAFISTVSEHSSGKAFSKLEGDSDSSLCRVRRADGVCEIHLSEVVVGDILLLSPGEIISADGYIISGSLRVDQSAMTGEGREVEKSAVKGFDGKSDPSDACSVFRGCPVLSGDAEAIVTAVGDRTFLGEISREIQAETRESPLRVRLSKLAGQISKIGYVMAFLVAFAYLFNVFVMDSGFKGAVILLKISNAEYLISKLFSAFILGLTVLVMAVPEGLPMMIAVVLSSNLRKMLRDNVLVRKAVGIEAAGSMNILFTDKTGTLTEGRPGVGRLVLGDLSEIDIKSLKKSENRLKSLFLLSCFYNSSSELSKNGEVIGGNAADRAFLESVKSWGKPRGYSVVKKEPFDSSKKYSSAILGGKESLKLIKGAPEKLLPEIKYFFDVDGVRHPFDESKLKPKIKELSEAGGRILLLAVSEKGGGLTLIAATELIDRCRREAKDSVMALRGAGIHVVMLTGDSKETASRIASDCGIINTETDICLTSSELAKLSDIRLSEILPRLAVLARALPTDKSRLVRVAQESGLVVGMTGDGVNDAPALRTADVGFSMGSGTDVAKEAGDIVILDNNLASIVKAVLYGRTVFKSIRKFVTLQLLMNICACGVSMIGPFVGIDAPVTVIQMLWINVIMDTLGGLAFAGEAARERYMKEPPKRRDEPILNGYMIYTLLFHGGFTLALGMAFLKHPVIIANFDGMLCHLTAFFAFFIFSSVLNCFCARTDRLNIFSDIGKNKVFLIIMAMISAIQIIFIYLGGSVLRTTPLTSRELIYTLGISLIVIPADFARKLLWRILGKKNGY